MTNATGRQKLVAEITDMIFCWDRGAELAAELAKRIVDHVASPDPTPRDEVREAIAFNASHGNKANR